MAYIVSQLRKDRNTKYMTILPTTPSTISSPNTFGDEENPFTDFALESTYLPGTVYYLRFQIQKIPTYFYSGSKTPMQVNSYQADADNLNLQIILKNDDDDEETTPPEVIGTCSVPQAKVNEKGSYSSYSFVFQPSKPFTKLGFRIMRVSFDAINVHNTPRNWLISDLGYPDYDNGKRWTGAQINGEWQETEKIVQAPHPRIKYNGPEGDVCILNDLVTRSPAGEKGWLKFGYQCRPGSLIVVNKEPIRIGRSGIYEIDNGTIIKSFMVASPNGNDNDNIDAFLLDYAYNNDNT